MCQSLRMKMTISRTKPFADKLNARFTCLTPPTWCQVACERPSASSCSTNWYRTQTVPLLLSNAQQHKNTGGCAGHNRRRSGRRYHQVSGTDVPGRLRAGRTRAASQGTQPHRQLGGSQRELLQVRDSLTRFNVLYSTEGMT